MNRTLIATPLAAAALLIAAALPATAHDPHPVRPGDTLSGIAAAHDTGWPDLWRANRNLLDSPHLIYPGQKLAIEGRAKTPSRSKAAPAATTVVRPATGAVTSGYGWRTHPITGVYKRHTGTDFAYGDGLARAAKAGTVSVEYPGWAGNLVVVDHGGGVVTQYAHLASVSVAPGERVAAGDVVGRIGSRGLATGAHLHFEVLVGGDYVNPLAWLERNGAP